MRVLRMAEGAASGLGWLDFLSPELDKRFANTVRVFNQARTASDVAGLWAAAAEVGEFAGALWAGLTHARYDADLHRRICNDLHMFQFQAAAFASADLARVDELVHENKVLAHELARIQTRYTQWQTDLHTERSAAQQEMLRLRCEVISRDTLIGQLRLGHEQSGAYAVEHQMRLQWKARSAELAERLSRTQHALDTLTSEHKRLCAERPVQATDAPTPTTAPVPVQVTECVDLQSRSILCVGGRPASVPLYRHIVERTGGRFLHHDGGEEHSVARLDATLAAADLVICQTGCISHNAYWRVKDHCKRTGKPCVFVENPGSGSLKRALAELQPVALSAVRRAQSEYQKFVLLALRLFFKQSVQSANPDFPSLALCLELEAIGTIAASTVLAQTARPNAPERRLHGLLRSVLGRKERWLWQV